MTDVVGATEAAEILGVSRRRFYQLVDLYADFPEPVARLARGSVWDRGEIKAWAKKERKPGRPWPKKKSPRPKPGANVATLVTLVLMFLTGTQSLGASEMGSGWHWPGHIRSILVLDEFIDTLPKLEEKREWRTIRGRVVSEWETTGFTFEIQRRDPSLACDPASAGGVPAASVVLCRTNAFNGAWATANTVPHATAALVALHRLDLALNWCHELGHVLGLGHRPYAEGTCMTEGGPQWAHPDAWDINQVIALHAHQDDRSPSPSPSPSPSSCSREQPCR